MKEIIKYQAYTGKEFHSVKECEVHEARCLRADELINTLPPRLKDMLGYLQHDPAIFNSFKLGILQLANDECPHKWFTQTMADISVDPSWANRIISDGCNERINRAWYRVMCTDKQYREWEQPYFASHPEEGLKTCLNK